MPLHHPFPVPPDFGELVPIAPGIFWLRASLPFALDHINLWVIEDKEGWALVDTGVADDRTRALWDRLFAGPLSGRRVCRVICTHFHPDHWGMAGAMLERWGVPPTATQGEWAFARLIWRDFDEDYRAHQAEHYRKAGYEPEMVAAISARGNTYRPRVSPPPIDYLRIKDGDELFIGGTAWRVITGGGHSPEHACLYSPGHKVLIAGDQVLPSISPIIGVWHQEPEARPLALFLESLDRLSRLPADTLVLPSHGLPFLGLGLRIDQLQAHHQGRLEKTLAACAEPTTAYAMIAALFRPGLDEHQTGFATGETLAHLNHLIDAGVVLRTTQDDGAWWFQALQSAQRGACQPAPSPL